MLHSWNRWLLKKVLKASAFFVQDESSKKTLNTLGYHHAIVTGDTRIDRVMDIVSGAKPLQYFDSEKKDPPILVAGSTWPADEFILKDFLRNVNRMWQKKQEGYNPDSNDKMYRLIIAPHDPSKDRVAELINLFDEAKPVVHSSWRGEPFKVMIIDSIGILNRLYGYAQVAYVGGGFGRGIHNILEPAAYGIPVFFGPKHHSFKEAESLIEHGVAFSIRNATELKSVWEAQIPQHLSVIKSKASNYFAANKGATAVIIDYLRALFRHHDH